MTQPLPTNRQLAEASAERIRDAGKWLIASFAAVGAALIAGSQFSSIGKLDACVSLSLVCTRLPIALLGAAAGLAAVVWAIWTAVNLLVPEHLPPSRLVELWHDPTSPIHIFFSENRSYFQGFRDFADLTSTEKEVYGRYDELSRRFDRAASDDEREKIAADMEAVNAEAEDIIRRGDAVVTLANRVTNENAFKREALPRLMISAAVAAVGIGLFAWAANPPTPDATPSSSLRGAILRNSDLTGVNLRNADLRGADLSGADLTAADLEGAMLDGAVLDQVTWSGTTCPDGRVSDDVGGSCDNHLTPS